MQITRDLKVGDKFRHVEYGECIVIDREPPLGNRDACWFRHANGDRMPTPSGDMWTGSYKNNPRYLELTDEPSAITLDTPDSIYPPWLDTASTERETQ